MTTAIDQSPEPIYGERVLALEPYTIERIPEVERHGHSVGLFPLWFGANLTIADFALGFLPIALGLPLAPTLIALALGNILGGALLALASAMGPATGYPQMIAGRWPFGRMGEYLPAALNWMSTVGWFTVNNILGSFGLQVLFPGLPFGIAALILVIIQVSLTVLGHNLVHAYERLMSVVLGVLFVVASIIALSRFKTITHYHGVSTGSRLALFAIILAASFSYIASWAPYASDYSRYLPRNTSRTAAFVWTFIGSALASMWLEVLGAFVAILAGPKGGNAIQSLHSVMHGFGGAAVVAIVLGATAADALNLYSNTLSARAVDIKISRPVLTVVAGAVALVLSLYGSGHFPQNYEHFLLLLDYWITPWVAILLVDFFLLRQRRYGGRQPEGVRWSGLISYLAAIAVSIPFMSTPLFTGPLADRLSGADFSYYLGFVVAGCIYFVWETLQRRESSGAVAGED